MRPRDFFFPKQRKGASKNDHHRLWRKWGAILVLPSHRRLLPAAISSISLFSLLAAVVLLAGGQTGSAQTDEYGRPPEQPTQTLTPVSKASSVAPTEKHPAPPRERVLPPTKNPDLKLLKIESSMVPEDGEASSYKHVRLQIQITYTGSTPMGGLTVKIDPDSALVFVGDVRGFNFTYEQNPSKATWKNVSIYPNQVITLSYLTLINEIAPGASRALTSKFEVSGDGEGKVVQPVTLTATPGDTRSQSNQGYVGG